MLNGKGWKVKVSELLNRMFELQYGGSSSTKFRWMQGYTDGYIQALIDMGFMPENAMLELIRNERASFMDTQPTHQAVKKAA